MRMSCLTALAVVPVLLVGARAGDAAKDLAQFQGTWTPLSLEERGKKAPAEDLKNLIILIQNNKMTIRDGGKDISLVVFKLDASKNPKSIDLTAQDGPEKGKLVLGIYQFDFKDPKNETLKMCVDDGGKMRPADFTTSEKSARSLIVLKKTK